MITGTRLKPGPARIARMNSMPFRFGIMRSSRIASGARPSRIAVNAARGSWKLVTRYVVSARNSSSIRQFARASSTTRMCSVMTALRRRCAVLSRRRPAPMPRSAAARSAARGMPTPESETMISQLGCPPRRAGRDCSVTDTRPPSGVYCTAFDSRFTSRRVIIRRSKAKGGNAISPGPRRRTPFFSASGRSSVTASLTHSRYRPRRNPRAPVRIRASRDATGR